MRTTFIAMALAASVGCAGTQKQAARPMPKESDDRAVASASASTPAPTPKELGGAAVKIVAKKPSAQKYKFVGRIEARAATGDIVDAAIAADADLRRQAKALGADVVKLDVITPPSEHASKHGGRVILAGRAYKKSS